MAAEYTIGKTKRLYAPNMEALGKTLNDLKTGRITSFPIQNRFYVFLEMIKFPWLMKWHERNNNFKTPYYTAQNHRPVINWLLDRGIISKKKETNCVRWNVNQKALDNLSDLSPTYKVTFI